MTDDEHPEPAATGPAADKTSNGLTADEVVVEELAERYADLRVIVERHEAELRAHERALQDLTELAEAAAAGNPRPAPAVETAGPAPDPDAPSTDAGSDGGSGPDGDTSSDSDTSSDGDSKAEQAGAPTFIVFFNQGSNEEHDELLALDNWIRDVLIPTYIRQVSSRQPWCARWWEHPEAVARLHALWMAWQELTDEQAGGHTGPSVWHRDHLDDAMAKLRSPDGPFNACMINPRQPTHRANLPTPIEIYPELPPARTTDG